MAEIIQNDDNMRTESTRDYSNETIGHEHKRLFYLHELEDFKVADEDPDVRGWKVKLESGEVVGTVENLIVDKAARRVRYLEVTTDRGFFSNYNENTRYLDQDVERTYKTEEDDHFLLPIGMAILDHSDNEVHVSGVTTDMIGGVPRYRRGNTYLPTYERDTIDYYIDNDYTYEGEYDRARYQGLDNTSYRSLDDQFYTSGFFSDDKFYNRHKEAQRGI